MHKKLIIILVFIIINFQSVVVSVEDQSFSSKTLQSVALFRVVYHYIAPDEQIIRAKVTAYAPFDNKSGICADRTPKTTSIGKTPSRGVVAVDPRRIPYGTKLYVPGYGEVVAGDTGGALRDYKGVQLDVFMETHQQAIKWGVKYLDIIVKDD